MDSKRESRPSDPETHNTSMKLIVVYGVRRYKEARLSVSHPSPGHRRLTRPSADCQGYIVPTSRLDIDLSCIERNLRLIRGVVAPEPDARRLDPNPKASRASKVGVCAVVKQDGYGAGAARIAKRLHAAGVEMFSVYTIDEARVIAEAVPGAPILILMPVYSLDRQDPLYRHLSGARVHFSLHSVDQFNALSETASRIGVALPVHVQIDTGMSRGGTVPAQAVTLLESVLDSQKMRLAGMMTHFASPCCDESYTREQARLFRDFVETVKPAIKTAVGVPMRQGAGVQDILLHAANSCATFRSRALHGSLVRCGQAMLGYLTDDLPVPDSFEFAAQARALQPAIRWTSSIVHIQEIPAGWAVGYGSTWRAPYRADGKPTKIAIIPVGYADGYPRTLGGEGGGGPGWVGLTGRQWERKGAGEHDETTTDSHAQATVYAPVVGRVSMDQITVDVTDVPEALLKFGPAGGDHAGPEVEIYSRRLGAPNYLPKLATASGSITHELLCRIGPRVERVHRYPASSATEAVSSSPHSPHSAHPTIPGLVRMSAGTGGIGSSAAVAQ